MADVTRTNIGLNAGEEVTVTSGAASQTFPVDKDQNIMITLANTSAAQATATFKANGTMAGGKDLVQKIANGEEFGFLLESARFKGTDGKLTLTITGSGVTASNVKIRFLRASLGDVKTQA